VVESSKSLSINEFQWEYSNFICSFGFEDHISQPQIKGLDPEPGAREPLSCLPG
jgi:hypothetical protein